MVMAANLLLENGQVADPQILEAQATSNVRVDVPSHESFTFPEINTTQEPILASQQPVASSNIQHIEVLIRISLYLTFSPFLSSYYTIVLNFLSIVTDSKYYQA